MATTELRTGIRAIRQPKPLHWVALGLLVLSVCINYIDRGNLGVAAKSIQDELRFTPEEAAAFLNERMGLTLTPEMVQRLVERTEGWIAGLQLAALSLQGEADPSRTAERILDSELQRPFDLERGPLLRLRLLRLGEDEYQLVRMSHHLIHDAAGSTPELGVVIVGEDLELRHRIRIGVHHRIVAQKVCVIGAIHQEGQRLGALPAHVERVAGAVVGIRSVNARLQQAQLKSVALYQR